MTRIQYISSQGIEKLRNRTIPINGYTTIKEKKKDVLQSKFGLTKDQTDVYILLEKYGPQTVPELSEKIKLSRNKIFLCLSELERLGLSIIPHGHPIKYSSIPLKKALQLLEKKKNRYSTTENTLF